jgi:hypothetical protein
MDMHAHALVDGGEQQLVRLLVKHNALLNALRLRGECRA